MKNMSAQPFRLDLYKYDSLLLKSFAIQDNALLLQQFISECYDTSHQSHQQDVYTNLIESIIINYNCPQIMHLCVSQLGFC